MGRKGIAIWFVCMWAFAFPLSASSLALRTMDKGSQVPDLALAGISGEGGNLSSFAGEKGLVVIYWATWSSRSVDILRFAEKSLRAYEKLGVKIVAVNADHQEMKAEDVAAVKAKAAELGLSFPVLLDEGLKGYNEIGIISTPTTLLLDRTLKLVTAYPGFPSIARDDIPERIDAFLGIVREKRPEKTQYLLDHPPKNHALMYYNLGKRLFLVARSPSGNLSAVPESAVEKLDEAIRRDPGFFRPYLLKAIIFGLVGDGARREAALGELGKRDFQEVYEQRVLGFGYLYLGMDNAARDTFKVLSTLAPEDAGVRFGQAVAAARGKDGAMAREALGALAGNARAKEELGADHVPLFTGAGELQPGTERALRAILDRLLEIEKQAQGAIRPDAPVQPGGAPAPGTPAPR